MKKIKNVTNMRKPEVNLEDMMKKIILAAVIVSLSLAQGYAGSVDAMPFLRMGVSARAMGMGSAFAGVSDDLASSYYNPAGVALIGSTRLSLMTAMLSNDRSMNWFAAGLPMRNSALSLSVLMSGVSDIPGATFDGTNASLTGSSFDSSDMAAALTYAKNYWTTSVGASVKYFSSSLDSGKATGFGFDMGLRFQPLDKLSAGFVIQDMASSRKWDTANNTAETVPTVVKVGAAYKMLDGKLTLAADEGKISDTGGSRLNAGAEYLVTGGLSARVGLDDGNFTAGFGVAASGLTLSYALRFENIDDNSNRQYISLDYAFMSSASAGAGGAAYGKKEAAPAQVSPAKEDKKRMKKEAKRRKAEEKAKAKAEKKRLKEEKKAKAKNDKELAEMKKHFNKATKLYQKRKYEKAIAEWEKVLEINPEHQQSKDNIEKARKKLED